MLKRLGINWEELHEERQVSPSPELQCCSKPVVEDLRPKLSPVSEPTPSVSTAMPPPPPTPLPIHQTGSGSAVGTNDGEEDTEKKGQSLLYQILDQFTETSEEELKKINHVIIGNSGSKNRGYRCLKCYNNSKYFAQAKKHNNEHEFERLRPIIEKLKKAELERKSEDQNIDKIKKSIGHTEKKKIIKALRQITENLTKHLVTLDEVEKTTLPEHIKLKFTKHTTNLTATIDKGDKIIARLEK